MITQNRMMQEEEKKRAVKVNTLKKYARVTKYVSSFVKILAETANLPSNTNTSYDPSNPLLQVLLYLYTYNTKDNFYRLHEKIGKLSNQRKCMVAEEIVWKWGRGIVGSGACIL